MSPETACPPSPSLAPSSRVAPPARFALLALLTLPAFALAGCSLIKVNGKPLGGGASSSEAASSESGSSEPGSSDDYGRRTAAEEPRKCFAVQETSGTLEEFVERIQRRAFEDAAVDFVSALCTKDGDLGHRQAEVRELRAAWMAQHHLDERDVDYLYRRSRGHGGNDYQELEKFRGPVGDYGQIWESNGDRSLLLDRLGSDATTLARVAVVRACFELSARPYTSIDQYPLLPAILCTREPIVLARAFAEIEAEPALNDQSRYDLRQMSALAADATARARGELSALAKEEPGVAKLVAIADAEFRRWAQPAPLRTRLVKQLTAMEAATVANKRSGFAGCEDATSSSWGDTVSAVKLPAATSKHPVPTYADATLASAEGYLAYAALRLCATAGRRDPQVALDTLAPRWVRRGPRTATVASWLMMEPIVFDDRGVTWESLLEPFVAGPGNDWHGDAVAGVIDRIEPNGAFSSISFKQVKELRMGCLNSKETSRVRAVTTAGRLEYDEVCTKRGKVMVDLTPPSITFSALLGRGLKRGQFLIAAPGLPVVATSSKSSKTPVFVLGASLQ